MRNGMSLVLWSSDPLLGVVTRGSAGLIIIWFLLAALVGSAVGMLRSLESPPQRRSIAPPPHKRRRPPLKYQPAASRA
jgi:hypothetical protein